MRTYGSRGFFRESASMPASGGLELSHKLHLYRVVAVDITYQQAPIMTAGTATSPDMEPHICSFSPMSRMCHLATFPRERLFTLRQDPCCTIVWPSGPRSPRSHPRRARPSPPPPSLLLPSRTTLRRTNNRSARWPLPFGQISCKSTIGSDDEDFMETPDVCDWAITRGVCSCDVLQSQILSDTRSALRTMPTPRPA